MKQLNIKIDDSLYSTLAAAADQRGIPITTLARERLLSAGQAATIASVADLLRDAISCDGDKTRALLRALATDDTTTNNPTGGHHD